ncbi:membrane protein [Leptolyngbya sp. Heron Island J]|uniref:DUF1614 domain-containing protein n=1 Tax=Leptolyngbya sp. Heron Island J TaxID=1385935 RepID=UPI0003B9E6A8|nr:DUF1614 domain-containing protein [Leptolyngbya sp. Heron Island J]ESA34025.1 membrane protein [Leptolyngbya sp. Heron Island J]
MVAASSGDQVPAVAFAGRILGVLIGADFWHLHEIEPMASGVLNIGGAGVFDRAASSYKSSFFIL